MASESTRMWCVLCRRVPRRHARRAVLGAVDARRAVLGAVVMSLDLGTRAKGPKQRGHGGVERAGHLCDQHPHAWLCPWRAHRRTAPCTARRSLCPWCGRRGHPPPRLAQRSPCEASTTTHTQTTRERHTSGSLGRTRPDVSTRSGSSREDHPQAPAREGGGVNLGNTDYRVLPVPPLVFPHATKLRIHSAAEAAPRKLTVTGPSACEWSSCD